VLDLELTPRNIIWNIRRWNSMTIDEVSKKIDLSQDTLLYYERIGLIPGVKRGRREKREYTEEDCKWIEFILGMRISGVPIEVLVEYITLIEQGIKPISL
jgi:DNA-binding transcriptional MerR regulator